MSTSSSGDKRCSATKGKRFGIKVGGSSASNPSADASSKKRKTAFSVSGDDIRECRVLDVLAPEFLRELDAFTKGLKKKARMCVCVCLRVCVHLHPGPLHVSASCACSMCGLLTMQYSFYMFQ